MDKKKINKILKIVGIVLVAILLVVIAVVAIYLGDYSKADEVATEIYNANGKSLEFVGTDNSVGFIVYPGGKVDEIAYVRTAKLLNDEGYTAVVAKFPFNIGFLGINKADDIMEKYPDVEKWVMIGHSLGGVSASAYTNDNQDKVAGLVLEASYSTEDLKDSDIQVLSIRGSNDLVLNMEGYVEAQGNYNSESNNYSEIILDGANHAGFGNYGLQKGDGENTIGYEAQQEVVVNETLKLIENLK